MVERKGFRLGLPILPVSADGLEKLRPGSIEDGFGLQGDGRISLKVLPQWDVDLLPNWVYTRGEPRYFGTQGSRYLFGRQRAQSLSLTLRSTYTFTPRLTLQAYAQAILESEHFSDYSVAPARGAGC